MFIKRASIIVAAAMALLLVAALAYAASGSGDSTSTATTLGATQAATSQIFAAGDSGRVQIDASPAGSLSVGSVDPAAGWAYQIEVPSGREVEVEFDDGNQRVDFRAELEGGQIKTRVRTELSGGDDGRNTRFTNAGDGEVITYDADGAGTVQVRRTATGLELVNAQASAGWDVAKTEVQGREIEVEFRNGATELEFKAEIEDGMIRVRTETRNDVGRSDPSSDDGVDDDSGNHGADDSRGRGSDDATDHDADDDSGSSH